MSLEMLIWLGFFVLIIGMLIIDLGIFHRKEREIKMKEALMWTIFWIFLSLSFATCLLFARGKEISLQFLAGYLIEKSLSIDNIFVFSLVFSYFKVPQIYIHRVLFWGIFSALIMRGLMIGLGMALISKFQWITYIFGALLIYTAVKLLFEKKEEEHFEQKFFINFIRKFVPISPNFHGPKFFIKNNGLKATQLFIVLLVLETSDLIFAIDSIPAIFAISNDTMVIYTSNIFAILGLRSLYFVLANILGMFYYLKYGLSAVLAFVGLKMLLAHVYKIPISLSLLVIISILTISILCSALLKESKNKNL